MMDCHNRPPFNLDNHEHIRRRPQSPGCRNRPPLNMGNAKCFQQQPQPPRRPPTERSLKDRMKNLACTMKQYEEQMKACGCTDSNSKKDYEHLVSQMCRAEEKYRAKEISYLEKIQKLENLIMSTEFAYDRKILDMEKHTKDLNNCVENIQKEFNQLQGVAHGLMLEREQRMKTGQQTEDPEKLKKELECERRRTLKLMNEIQCTNQLLDEQRESCLAETSSARAEAMQYKRQLVNTECDLAQLKEFADQWDKYKEEQERKMSECSKHLKNKDEICKKMQERLNAEGLGGIVERFNRDDVKDLPSAVEGLQAAFRNARAIQGKTSVCCQHLIYVSQMSLKLANFVLGTREDITCDTNLDDDDEKPSGSAGTATRPSQMSVSRRSSQKRMSGRPSGDVTVSWAFCPHFPFIKTYEKITERETTLQDEPQKEEGTSLHQISVVQATNTAIRPIDGEKEILDDNSRAWLCRILEEAVDHLRPGMFETSSCSKSNDVEQQQKIESRTFQEDPKELHSEKLKEQPKEEHASIRKQLKKEQGDEPMKVEHGKSLPKVEYGKEQLKVEHEEEPLKVEHGEEPLKVKHGEDSPIVEHGEESLKVEHGEESLKVEHGESPPKIEHGKEQLKVEHEEEPLKVEHEEEQLKLKHSEEKPKLEQFAGTKKSAIVQTESELGIGTQVEECIRMHRTMHDIPKPICLFAENLMEPSTSDAMRRHNFFMDFISRWHTEVGFRTGVQLLYRIAVEMDAAHNKAIYPQTQVLMQYSYENLVAVLKILKGLSIMLGAIPLPKILKKVQNCVSKTLLKYYRPRMEEELFFTVYHEDGKPSDATRLADARQKKANNNYNKSTKK